MAHDPNGLLVIPEGTKVKVYPNPKTKGLKDVHWSSKDVLFPTAPALTDIKQGSIGDCYLLAAIMGIINSKDGPEKIEKMMSDDNTHITLRLFNTKKKARYLKIEKSVVYTWFSSDQKHANSPLWVVMIEKGYAAWLGRKESPDKDYYTELLGGGDSPDVAMAALLGGETLTYQATESGLISIMKMFVGDLMAFQKGTIAPDEELCKAALGEEDTDALATWKSWAGTVNRGLSLFNALTGAKVVRLEIFLKWFDEEVKKAPLEDRIVESIKHFIQGNNMLAGKRGTGRYSKPMLELYNKIKDALDKKQAVAISTHNTVSHKKSEKTGTVGEPEWKGLYGKHAYTVLNVDEMFYAGNKEVSLKMVLLRNPHGETGRKYFWKNKDGVQVLSAKETKDGQFWVELTDVMKRFDRVSVGKDAETLVGE
jgi:hypothetical protein